jgi:uncharacterized damage-inducible protein DinB
MADIEAADRRLLDFLNAQRQVVLEIVDGLPEDALRQPVVPSGWSPLGMIEHLGGAELYWFQVIAMGQRPEVPWEEDDEDEDADGPFTTRRSLDTVAAFYRDQCDRANAYLTTRPLSTPPVGRAHGDLADQATDLRWIVLHMIEETARHAGHLDIARELIDGRTGLGPR